MAQKVALVGGVVLLLLGIFGLVENPVVGREAFFRTNLVHDVVHMVSGALLLGVLGKERTAGIMLKFLGIVYLLVTILGFVMPEGLLLGVMEINSMDNWLNLALAVIFLLTGFMSKPDKT